MDIKISYEGDLEFTGNDLSTIHGDEVLTQTIYWILRTTNPDWADDTQISPNLLKIVPGRPNTRYDMGEPIERVIKDKLVRAGIAPAGRISVKTGPLSAYALGILIKVQGTDVAVSLSMSLKNGALSHVSSTIFGDPEQENPILLRNPS